MNSCMYSGSRKVKVYIRNIYKIHQQYMSEEKDKKTQLNRDCLRGTQKGELGIDCFIALYKVNI